jgi:hypothetical protein
MLNINRTLDIEGVGRKHAIHLFLFGDMHCDDKGFSNKGFETMTEDIMSRGDKALAFQMGDISDMSNRRTRASLKSMVDVGGTEDIYNTLDAKAYEAQEKAIDLCRPFKDKIVFGVIGNHGWDYYNVGDSYGSSLDENWADRLEVPLAKAIATCNVGLRYGTRQCWYRVMARHGNGGARTETGDHNKLETEMRQYEGVDLFAGGHTHHHYAHKIRPRVFFSKCGEPISRNLHVARTGTFKRNLRNSAMDPSYEEIAGYSPAGLGYIHAEVWMERRRRDGVDVNYAQSQVTAVPTD